MKYMKWSPWNCQQLIKYISLMSYMYVVTFFAKTWFIKVKLPDFYSFIKYKHTITILPVLPYKSKLTKQIMLNFLNIFIEKVGNFIYPINWASLPLQPIMYALMILIKTILSSYCIRNWIATSETLLVARYDEVFQVFWLLWHNIYILYDITSWTTLVSELMSEKSRIYQAFC